MKCAVWPFLFPTSRFTRLNQWLSLQRNLAQNLSHKFPCKCTADKTCSSVLRVSLSWLDRHVQVNCRVVTSQSNIISEDNNSWLSHKIQCSVFFLTQVLLHQHSQFCIPTQFSVLQRKLVFLGKLSCAGFSRILRLCVLKKKKLSPASSQRTKREQYGVWSCMGSAKIISRKLGTFVPQRSLQQHNTACQQMSIFLIHKSRPKALVVKSLHSIRIFILSPSEDGPETVENLLRFSWTETFQYTIQFCAPTTGRKGLIEFLVELFGTLHEAGAWNRTNIRVVGCWNLSTKNQSNEEEMSKNQETLGKTPSPFCSSWTRIVPCGLQDKLSFALHAQEGSTQYNTILVSATKVHIASKGNVTILEVGSPFKCRQICSSGAEDKCFPRSDQRKSLFQP